MARQPPRLVQATLVHSAPVWQHCNQTYLLDVRCDRNLARVCTSFVGCWSVASRATLHPLRHEALLRRKFASQCLSCTTHLHELTRELGAVLGHLLGFGLLFRKKKIFCKVRLPRPTVGARGAMTARGRSFSSSRSQTDRADPRKQLGRPR